MIKRFFIPGLLALLSLFHLPQVHGLPLNITTNPNGLLVQEELNSITNPTIEESALLAELTTLSSSINTFDVAINGLNQMSGEQYTSLQFISELSSRQFLRRIYAPLRPVLTASTYYFYNCSYDENEADSNNCGCTKDSKAWFSAGGGRSFLDNSRNAGGFKMDSYQIDLGFQKTLDAVWTVGIAAGYQHDYVKYDLSGTGKNDTGLLGIYSLYRPENFYVLTDIIFGFTYGKMHRNIALDPTIYHAKSTPKSVQGTFYIETGTNFNYSNLLLQPFFGVELAQFSRQKTTERDAIPLNLSISTKNKTLAHTRLGIHLSTGQFCSINCNVDLAWQYRLTTSSNKVKERFTDFGDSFTVSGISPSRNSFDGTINFSTIITDTWTLFTELSGQRWENASTYNLTVGILANW